MSVKFIKDHTDAKTGESYKVGDTYEGEHEQRFVYVDGVAVNEPVPGGFQTVASIAGLPEAQAEAGTAYKSGRVDPRPTFNGPHPNANPHLDLDSQGATIKAAKRNETEAGEESSSQVTSRELDNDNPDTDPDEAGDPTGDSDRDELDQLARENEADVEVPSETPKS